MRAKVCSFTKDERSVHEAPMHGWHRDFAPREGVVGGGMQRRSKGGRQVAGGQESAVVSMCMLKACACACRKHVHVHAERMHMHMLTVSCAC